MLEREKRTGQERKTRPMGPSLQTDLSLIEAIKNDHEDLKSFIEVLKDPDIDYSEKKKAYPDFADHLQSHAHSEETAVYKICQEVAAMRIDTFEALEEHRLADMLLEKISVTRNKDQWMARVKVLAESVEHHILEEESDYLPEVESNIKQSDQEKMVRQFLMLRKKSQKILHNDNSGANKLLS